MNRLGGEPSAYLRQHAQNPVAWQPFDDAAFAEAVARDAPIFLSVGYAACHWCHVMAGESFEDPAIAVYLNEYFVSIKVDREERPDVDDAYMAATQALSGQGGWPMSVFLTPAGKAFYAGTYFPPVPGAGQPSFKQVLVAVHEAWTERRGQVEQTADSLAETLAKPLWQVRAAAAGKTQAGPTQAGPTAQAPSAVELESGQENNWQESVELAVAAMLRAEDPVNGGFGQAPKFPPTPGLEFLLRHAAAGAPTATSAATSTSTSAATSTSAEAGGLAGRTLGAMVRSALFDQLGGGFARYSVTADWSEPHYEKMLYDNAGLLRVLVHWIRLAGETPQDTVGGGPSGGPSAGPSARGPAPLGAAEARAAVSATIAWLMAEMRLPGGAFASSLDADTVIDGVHHEGASYKWTVADLAAAAADGELAAQVAGFMGIGPGEARPFHPVRALAAQEQARWERIKPALLAVRAGRVMPARDDKVVASWNGMLMASLAEAAMVLDEPAWLAAAVELGEYLQDVHWNGQLFRVSHEGKARGIKGLLEDYAACANGCLSLYAATGDARWFEFAGELVQAMEQEFIADGVVLNRGAGDGSDGAVPGSRTADPFDNATASGVAMMAEAFISWAAYTGSVRHRNLVESMLSTLPDLARRAPRSAGGMLSVAEALRSGPRELAVVGVPGPERDALVRTAWESTSPGLVIAVWDGVGPVPAPLFEGRAPAGRGQSSAGGPAADASPLAYVCRNMVCARPVATPEELAKLLR